MSARPLMMSCVFPDTGAMLITMKPAKRQFFRAGRPVFATRMGRISLRRVGAFCGFVYRNTRAREVPVIVRGICGLSRGKSKIGMVALSSRPLVFIDGHEVGKEVRF